MGAPDRYLKMDARELRLELEQLYADYVGCLDEERFEDWPQFFTEDCIYRIVPRENFERGLPIATWHSEGRNGLLDRVVAIRKTLQYAPRYVRRMVSAIRPLGWQGDTLEARANYLALETLLDEPTRVFQCGQYHDRIVAADGRLRFREKVCVFDTLLIPNSIIYPL